MLIYYLILLVIIGAAYPLCFKNPSKLKTAAYVGGVFVILYVVSMLRFAIGNDYFSYYRIFQQFFDVSFIDLFKQGYEPGFSLITWLLSRVTQDIVVMHGVYSFLILVPFAYVIWKESDNVAISCFLFVCVTFFYTTMNFTRQSMAAALIFLAWHFIKNKKPIFVILLSIAAILFHYTAAVFLVFYLLSFIKPKPIILAIYGALTVALYFTSDLILNFGFDILEKMGLSYASYRNSVYLSALSPVFIIIPALILAFVIAAYFMGWGKNVPEARLLVNFSAYSFIFWVFVTKYMVLERFSMYVYIFVLIAIPSIFNYYFSGKTISGDEKAELLKQRKPNAKIPSKKYAPNRELFVFLSGVLGVACLVYNIFGMNENFHGVFPYTTWLVDVQQSADAQSDSAKAAQALVDCNNEYSYLLKMQNKNFTYILTVKGDFGSILTPPMTEALKRLGLTADFSANPKNSYIAVISGGQVEFEKTSEQNLDEKVKVLGADLTIKSGEISSIMIDGQDTELSLNNTGLNIVVFDTASTSGLDRFSIVNDNGMPNDTRYANAI